MQSLTFFTICSKNFTAYARTLFASVRQNHPDAELYMFLCDGVDSGYDPRQLPFSTVPLDDLDIPDLQGMAHRYNITEFNTAVKPYAFAYLFRKIGREKVIYLDPDILVMTPLQEVAEALEEGAECVLTPHLLEPAEHAEMSDNKMLLFGIYNLGFVAFRNTPDVLTIVDWWARRLEFGCVIKLEEGLFVDQKWADLFPAFIRRTAILHHAGYNVAYWNLSQRTIRQTDGVWTANGQPLRFVHFSGNHLDDPTIFSRHSATVTRETIGDLRSLHDRYRQMLLDNGHREYAKLPYSFSWHGANGVNLHALSPECVSGSAGTGQPEENVVAPGFLNTVMAARSLAGGWLPLLKRAVTVLLSEGVGALGSRIDLARDEAKYTLEHAVAGSQRRPLPKLFITDWSIPRPDQDAGSVSTFFFLKILVELGYDVTFVPSDLERQGNYSTAVELLGVRCLYAEDIGTVAQHLQQSGSEYAVFILFRAPIAALYLADIRKYAPRGIVILETVDLHYLREERSAQVDGSREAIDAAEKAKEYELGIMKSCDISIVLSPFEKELLAKELPQADIRTMPLLFLDMQGPAEIAFADRQDILFIGGFRHLPNIDAMVWFCHEIWPLVRQRLPEANFLIVGSHPTPEVQALADIAGVRLLGHVKNIDPVFAGVRLSVAPIRFGAGLKGKVVTSLGYGVPVVGTRIAFEGMELRDNEHVIFADDAASFVDAIVGVYSNPELWQKLSENGFERIWELYSESAGRVRLKTLMDSLQVKTSDFQFHRFSSQREYRLYRQHSALEYKRREKVELELIRHGDDCFYVDGYCVACGRPASLQVGFMYSYRNTDDGRPVPNWREHLNCVKCGFTNRIRLIVHLLQQVIRPREDARIYLTEQATPLYGWLKARYPQLVGSEYLGDSIPSGSYRDGLRNEDLTALSFPDDTFDLIISLDVLEHVSDDVSAFAECYRCLAPGGTLVFTAPCTLGSSANIVRAKVVEGGGIEHLVEPPEYHGNPVDPEGGALCFRYFGWEVLEQLKEAGFENPHLLSAWSLDLGYLGGEQIVFCAHKVA